MLAEEYLSPRRQNARVEPEDLVVPAKAGTQSCNLDSRFRGNDRIRSHSDSFWRFGVLARDIFQLLVIASSCILASLPASAATPRARDIGIPLDGKPGAGNAITDVAGVKVGHTTLIRGEGALKVGEGPVRTGVTVIFPRADRPAEPAPRFA